MSETYTNALVNETSPYLLQHAHNPVNWYPWGEEAIDKAQREDKPIFLSIGYSACHWCHVMEHESFENQEIAAYLNEHYVSIKVDREERPDLDEIYMQAVFMITQHGGWPMSVFLTPQLKPFFAGTYFPPRDGPRGMGFLSILGRLKDAYDQQRDEIDKNGDELVRLIAQSNELIKAEGQGPELAMLDHAVAALRRNYDSYHGGFGGAPKFPPHMSLNLLLREFDRTGELDMLEMVTGTLNHMMRGGIHDQILGGFARYSVDQQWLVPHFEKMLYDNGQLAERYFEAWQVTKNDDYLRVGRRLLDWVIRDMTDDAGGYYSALDADSEGVEGKFYVWTPDEVNAVLDEEDARLFCEFYDITEGGNFEGKSIPNVIRPLEEFAKARGEDPARLREQLDAACAELEQARQKRVPPGRDDKVLTSWNGLMISGMCRGAQVTGDERYRESARRAADFILSEMRTEEGRLLRAWRQGRAKVPGFIDDYANCCVGLIDLYETTFEPRWLQAATELADRMLEDFYDAENGGFFTTDGRDPSVVVRRKETQDGATPSGNSQATVALLRLAVYLEESRYRDAAMKTIDGMNRYLKELPSAVQHLVCAVSMALGRSREVVVIGEPENEETRAIVDAIHRRYFPSMAMAVAESDGASDDFNRRIALLKDRTAENGRPTIYVCENNACRQPVHTAKEALDLLG